MIDNPYLAFEERPVRPDMKTKIWAVRSQRHGNVLGFVRWYGAWRQYTFWPEPGTIWNTGCLLAVNRFIEEQMMARQAV